MHNVPETNQDIEANARLSHGPLLRGPRAAGVLAAAALVTFSAMTTGAGAHVILPPATRPATQPAHWRTPPMKTAAADHQQQWARKWELFKEKLHAAASAPPLAAVAPATAIRSHPSPERAEIASPETAPSAARLTESVVSRTTAADVISGEHAPVSSSTEPHEVLSEYQALVPAAALVDGSLRITVNETRIIKTTRPYYRLSVASPEIADVTPLAPDSFLVSTKLAGNTQLVVWDEQDRSQTLLVQSEADLREVQAKLEQLLPAEKIEAVDLRGKIALRGRVSSVEVAERAVEIAGAYTDDVADFLEIAGTQQVMLEIRFAEVSRSAGKQLGFNFGLVGQDGSGASNIGSVNPFGPGVTDSGNVDPTNLTVGNSASPAVTLFGGGVVGDIAFEAFLSALRENNLLRVLAEPNLTLISGEQGEFLAGGRIPVPVPQGDETITIQYESFGIRLRALPVVLGNGRIRVRVEPEVSDIDRSTGVTVAGVSVPGFRVRQLSTEVELIDGQTFVLAGLLDSSVAASKQVTPLLGDVPILGALFRSTRYQRRETELVVLITPRLVSPLDPDEVPPLPGEKWKHPNEMELFLLGQLGGEAGVSKPHQGDVRNADDAATRRDPTAAPRLEAAYSFLPPEPAAQR